MTPPKNPNQVPPDLEDDVGKHDESEFNEDPDTDEDNLDEDDEENFRDDTEE